VEIIVATLHLTIAIYVEVLLGRTRDDLFDLADLCATPRRYIHAVHLLVYYLVKRN